MKRALICLCALTFSMILVATSFAEDEPKKKKADAAKKGGTNPAVTQLMKTLEVVKLTDDQQAKAKEMAATLQAELKELRAAGLSPELTKKVAEAGKQARAEGKKGKDLTEAVQSGLSDDEKALLAKSKAATDKFRSGVVGLLTDEQKALLPEQLKKIGQAKPVNEKKKKKDAA